MQVTFGAFPFFAVEQRGTPEAPDIMMWLEDGDDPAQAEVLKRAMLQWADNIRAGEAAENAPAAASVSETTPDRPVDVSMKHVPTTTDPSRPSCGFYWATGEPAPLNTGHFCARPKGHGAITTRPGADNVHICACGNTLGKL